MKLSNDFWVIAALLLFTVGMATWASLQSPGCQESAAAPGLWELTAWSVKLAIVQVGAALLLAVVTLSRRFIGPLPYATEQARMRGEYLTSMAQLFGKAQASHLAFELLFAQFRRDLATRVGLAPMASDEELLSTLTAQRPGLVTRVQEIFGEASEARVTAKSDEALVLSLAQRMATLREEWSRLT